MRTYKGFTGKRQNQFFVFGGIGPGGVTNDNHSSLQSHPDSLSRPISPLAGWLFLRVRPAATPTSGQVDFWLVPGTAARPSAFFIGALTGTPLTITQPAPLPLGFYDTNQFVQVTSFDFSDLTGLSTSERAIYMGRGGMGMPAHTADVVAPGLKQSWDNTQHLQMDMPAHWSLFVRTTLDVDLDVSGNNARFAPVYEVEFRN